MKENIQRFVQFAVEVWDVPENSDDPEGTALRGIEEIEKFYHSIGMPTSIHELVGRQVTEDEIKEMARKCTRNNTITHGHFKVLKAEDIEQIYRMAQ